MTYLLAFAVGAVIGSFLNVCIARLPEGQSIVTPRSRCPRCKARVRGYDNIPLLSYALLRGRCRDCGAAIGLRYPLVEVLMGLALAALLYRFGLAPVVAAYALLLAALIVVSFIDLDHQIIPDVISLPGIALGVLCARAGYGPPLAESVDGVLLGGGILYAVGAGYHALTGREGMGGGDIKLLAMIGAFLGWRAVLVTLVLGSFSGALVGGLSMVLRGTDSRTPIPFGPFLSLGGACALFFGDELLDWYLRLPISL